MSTELTIYDRIVDPMAAIKTLGHSIASSKMFGAETPAQGEIFALECLVRRTPPLMLAEKYHVIFGKLSMKAEAMLSRFEELGGKYRVLDRTPERAAIELTREGDKPQVFSLTWEEAKKEPFVYEPSKGVKESDIIDLIEKGTPPPIKTKYRTPRSRMQMLWARVVSDGVNAVDARVKSGTYTPEEISDFPENAGRPMPNGHTDGSVEDDVVDAEVVSSTVAEPPVEKPAASKPFVTGADGTPNKVFMCTADQSTRIKTLWGELGATVEQRNKQLESRGVMTCRQLTTEQAAELIGKLEAKLAKKNADPATTQGSTSAQPTLTDAELVAGIRERLTQVNQVHAGTIGTFKEKMATAKIARIDDLSRESLQELYDALGGDDIMAWFGQALFTPRTAKN